MNGTEHYYSSKDLIALLDIASSTLRKWCLALEEQEYFFSRTDNRKRVFTDRDIIVLKHLRNLIQVQNLSLENAAIIVAKHYQEDASEQKNTENTVPALRSDSPVIQQLTGEIETLKEQQEQLINLNKQLIQRMEEQQTYINERLEQRDSVLLESIREVQKSNKLLLEHKEEEKTKRKGFLRFFSKD